MRAIASASLLFAALLGGCAGDVEPAPDSIGAESAALISAPEEHALRFGCAERCTRSYAECLHYANDSFDQCLCDNEYAACRASCGLGRRPPRACWPE